MMMTTRNRKLAKGFWPVLLLSAALSLPAASVAAPSPNGKAAAADKHNKNKGRKEAQKHRAEVKRETQKHQAEVKRETQKRHAEVRRESQKRHAEVKRDSQKHQAELRYQSQRQAQQRQLDLQRQAQYQRQLELQRQAELRRQAQYRTDRNAYRNNQYQNRGYRDDNYYRNRFGRYSYRGNGYQEHLDGFVVDDRGECVLFREHRTGQIFALAGNIDDMREGDHIRYVGTHTYENYCGSGYPTMNVREIKTVWSNDRHEHAIFDTNRHGSYDRWADRYYGYDY